MDKFRYNAKRASLVQSRIKAIERMADIQLVEADPEYIFRCVKGWPGRRGGRSGDWGWGQF